MPNLSIYSCMICGATISPRFVVCAKCIKSYALGGKWSEWPQWARQLYADHRAEQRQEVGMLASVVDAPDQYDRLCYGEDDGMADGMTDNGEPLDDYASAWERLREMGIDAE